MKYIDIFKRVNVPSTPTALYKIVYVVYASEKVRQKSMFGSALNLW